MRRLYSSRDVAWFERRLEVLPPEPEGPLVLQTVRSIDAYHAIEQLIDCIADLQQFGLTLRQIADRLTELGFPIRERTLQSYLRRAQKTLTTAPPQTEAASGEDSSWLELDIEVIDEPVVDPELEDWFRKG